MSNLRPFQVALLAVFVFLAFLSIVLLRSWSPSSSEDANQYGDRVVLWGTFPYNDVSDVLKLIEDEDKAFDVVEYVSVPEERFASDFVNAIAEGRSPDLILLPHTELVNQRGKLQPILYSTEGYSGRDLRDRYVDGVDVFARLDGLYAIPIMVDPLVMYWNRDIFAGAGLANPPRSWEELVGSTVGSITRRDDNRNIILSAVAFGEFRNVRNVVPLLSLLALQSGSRMVEETDRNYTVALNDTATGGRPPLEAALQFYTDFANPSNPLYSWNRAQLEDRQAFLAADLALYFGFASESQMIQDRNPNLNFDVALPPQGAEATIQRTYGTFYGLAIPRASGNQQGAYNAANTLASAQNALNLAFALDHTPVHRAGLQAGTDDPVREVAYQTALFARGWLSPNPDSTAAAFQAMIEDVNSSRSRVSSAVSDAVNRLIIAY